MKYCDDHAALLDLYVDGELSPGDMAAVRAHLGQCPGCRAYVDDALALRAAFPSAEDTEVPPGFAQGVMAIIQTQAAPAKKVRGPWPRLLASLAACCAIVLLVRGVGLGSGSKASPTADTAATMETEACVEAPAPTAQAEEDDTTCALTAAPAGEVQYDNTASKNALEPLSRASSLYFAILTLPEDALETPLLADGTATGTEDGEQRYELSAGDYATLLDQLDASGIQPIAREQTGAESETALVVVTAP